ncbi:unnamed protein product [Clonostachys rhizophaga]|uniref:Uncharacterized protein n=1 Tax=Clonostachys rhizophaga TaxID=160324 RepID=A0A9N9VM16_9HYPO|nr:unnamed protein product [Clonostachys rhizophaga]
MDHREMMTDDDELKSVPLSLASVEEGQAGAQAQGPNDTNAMQEYAGLLAASALQERDSAYLSVRAFTLPYSFLQGYLERDVEECWEKIRRAILAGDDASVPGLVHEFKDKASSCVDMAKKRKFLAGLGRQKPRDLRVFLQYLTLDGTNNQQYPRDTSQWRGLTELEGFDDWARSIVMAKDSKICKWLALMASNQMIDINGRQKRLVDARKLISFLAITGGLGASILFGTPFVFLASEVFPRWGNIIIVVGWVILLLIFLIAWGVTSSSLFLFVLAYTTMLANVDMGGSK